MCGVFCEIQMFYTLISKEISCRYMGNIMCAFATKVFEEIYVLRVDRYWNLCFHGSFRTPFRPGWYKVLQKNMFRYQREKWIFISFLGWDYIIISLYHFIRRTNAMQWYGSDNIQLRYSSFHPRSHSDFAKLFSPRAHTRLTMLPQRQTIF